MHHRSHDDPSIWVNGVRMSTNTLNGSGVSDTPTHKAVMDSSRPRGRASLSRTRPVRSQYLSDALNLQRLRKSGTNRLWRGGPDSHDFPCLTGMRPQIGMPNILLRRDVIYKHVWERPMRQVAQDDGISDVGLKKACRRLDLPTPPSRDRPVRIDRWILPERDTRCLTPIPFLRVSLRHLLYH